jgi:hypothetical protein
VRFLVKVKVDLASMAEFGSRLQRGELDRGCMRGETHCLKQDPAVGYSIWEADDREAFERVFSSWSPYYLDVSVEEVISPAEAMTLLLSSKQ